MLTVPLKSLLHYRAKIKTVRWQGERSNHFHLSHQHAEKEETDWFSSSGMWEVPMAVHCSRRSAFSSFMPNSSFQTRKVVVVTTWVWQIEARMLCNRNNTAEHLTFDEICMLLAHSSYHWPSCLQVSNLLCYLIMFCKHVKWTEIEFSNGLKW